MVDPVMVAAAPIADRLFVDGPHPQLIGGRDIGTGRYVFPFPSGNNAAQFEEVLLNREGILWSWTIQRFRPKTPPYAGTERFEPYAMGYVELDGQLIVETRLVDVAFDAIRIGDRYRTVTASFEDGTSKTLRTMYAFAPAERPPS